MLASKGNDVVPRLRYFLDAALAELLNETVCAPVGGVRCRSWQCRSPRDHHQGVACRRGLRRHHSGSLLQLLPGPLAGACGCSWRRPRGIARVLLSPSGGSELGSSHDSVRAEEEVSRPLGAVFLQRSWPEPCRMGARYVCGQLASRPRPRIQPPVRPHAPCRQTAFVAVGAEGRMSAPLVLLQAEALHSSHDDVEVSRRHPGPGTRAQLLPHCTEALGVLLVDVRRGALKLQLDRILPWQQHAGSIPTPLKIEAKLGDVGADREEGLQRRGGMDIHHLVRPQQHASVLASRVREVDALARHGRALARPQVLQLMRGPRIGEQPSAA